MPAIQLLSVGLERGKYGVYIRDQCVGRHESPFSLYPHEQKSDAGREVYRRLCEGALPFPRALDKRGIGQAPVDAFWISWKHRTDLADPIAHSDDPVEVFVLESVQVRDACA